MPADNLQFTKRLVGDITVIRLSKSLLAEGEITSFSQFLKAELKEETRIILIVINDKTSISSSALGVLIWLHRSLAARSGRLALVCPKEIAEIFRITSLNKVIKVFRDEEEALASLQNP